MDLKGTQLVGAESVHFPQCLAAPPASAWGAARDRQGESGMADFTSTQRRQGQPRTFENNIFFLKIYLFMRDTQREAET